MNCGNGCVAVQSCLPASGECPSGTLACSIGCIDPMTSKDNCGKCDFRCGGATQLCTDGICHLPCAEGALFCGGACADISTHPLHCGGCNQNCPAMSACSGSACSASNAQHQLSGFLPTTLAPKDAYASFEKWKVTHVEDCGNGRARVKFDTAAETVSEGIGYGLLLTASWGDRALFEAILAYRNAVLKSNKLLPWRLNGCSGSVLDQGSAADGDLDVAMALLMADCVWPSQGYKDSALATINALRELVVKADGSRLFLLAGDSWGGDSCGNPSYYAPAYYRAFAKAGATNAADWTELAQDTYYYLNKAANSSTGLVGNWQKADSLSCSKSSSEYASYGYDAARTPWRIVTDYAWWGEAQAKTYATKVSNWAGGVGIANVVDGYSVSGSSTGEYKNSAFTGALALAGIAVSQQRSDQSHADWLGALPLGSDNSYYKASLRALYMLLSVGRFVPGCY
jgi:endo-1,4-beta-D-glucanase Y